MLDSELIARLKFEYEEIYLTSIRNKEYVFRPITRKEFKQAMLLGPESVEAEDMLVASAVVYPDDVNFDRMPAGVVTQLLMEILDVSGFTDPKAAKAILDKKREEAKSARVLMEAFIIAAMPAYKASDLDDLTFNQIAELLALAEQVIDIQQQVLGFEETGDIRLMLIDPEEEEQQAQAKQAKQHAARKDGQAVATDPIAAKLHQALG